MNANKKIAELEKHLIASARREAKIYNQYDDCLEKLDAALQLASSRNAHLEVVNARLVAVLYRALTLLASDEYEPNSREWCQERDLFGRDAKAALEHVHRGRE